MIESLRIPIRGCYKGYYLRWFYNGWHYWQFYNGKIEQITAGQKYRTTGVRQVELSSGIVTEAQIEAIRTLLNSTEVYVYTDGGWAECRHTGGEVFVRRNYINAYEMQCKILIGNRKISDTGYSVGVTKPYNYVPPTGEPGEIPSPEGLCALEVGTQIWSCFNYDVAYPGSVVYAYNPANRAIYGGLYTYEQCSAPDFCPPGWHVPSNAEWSTLNNYVGGPEMKPGKHLRSVGFNYWQYYSAEASGDDLYGFDLRGAGSYYKNRDGDYVFSSLKLATHLWSLNPGSDHWYIYTTHTSVVFPLEVNSRSGRHCSVRLIKD